MEKIRPLKESDKDDVLEIARHTWEGHDYLPYYFADWLKDSNSHTAAIEHDGRVIALANLRVIEDGQTGWMEGLRVHPDHRGKGLASILTKHIAKIATEIPVERLRYTTATDNQTSLHLAEQIGMKRKFDLAVTWLDLEDIDWRSSGKKMEQISGDQLYLDLASTSPIPHNVVIFEWKALDATETGLNEIGKVCKFWVNRDNDFVSSLSLGSVRKDSHGTQWSCTIYAKEESEFLTHLSHHLDIAIESRCPSIFVTYQTSFVKALNNLNLAHIVDGNLALTLLERTF